MKVKILAEENKNIKQNCILIAAGNSVELCKFSATKYFPT